MINDKLSAIIHQFFFVLSVFTRLFIFLLSLVIFHFSFFIYHLSFII